MGESTIQTEAEFRSLTALRPGRFDQPVMSFRLTVRRLMALIVLAGACLAAFRQHISLGSFLFGVISLAWLRTFGKLDRLPDAESAMRPWRLVRAFLASSLVATALLVVEFLPAFVLMPLFMPGGGINGHSPLSSTWGIGLTVAFGLLPTLLIRRWLW